MVVSSASYNNLAQQLAECFDDAMVDHAINTNEKKIDVAQSALDLYLGWTASENGGSGLYANSQSMNSGNQMFLDTLPLFDGEESDDPIKRREQRDAGLMFATYYDELDTNSKGEPKKKYFFDEFIQHIKPQGAELYARMKVIKSVEEKANAAIADDDPNKDIEDFTSYKYMLTTEKSYVQSKMNTLAKMARDAVGIHQQFNLFKSLWPDYRDANDTKDKRPGLRITINTTPDGAIARSTRVFVLRDDVVSPLQEVTYSVSSFLRVDIKLAAREHTIKGTASIKALKNTLKRAPEQTVAGIKPKNLDELTKFYHGLNDYLSLDGSSKLLDVRLLDPKRSQATALPMAIHLYEHLLPLEPVLKAVYTKWKEKEADKANNTRTNDAPPVDKKLETPRARLLRLRGAQRK